MSARRITTVALALLLGLGLSGCLQLDVDLAISADDTVDGTMVLAVTDQLAGMAGDDLFEGEDVPEGATVEPYSEGGFTGQRYVFDDTPLSQFAPDEEGGLAIVREGDRYVLSGNMDLRDESGEEPDALAMQMMEGADLDITVSFPGKVIETNGTISPEDPNTVSWEPQLGERNVLSAEAERSGDLPNWVGFFLILAAILLAGGLAYYLLVHRQGSRTAVT